MPRRIDIVTHYWPPIGGPGSRKMQMWARAFVEAGYRVRVVTPVPHQTDPFFQNGLTAPDRVEVVRVPVLDPSRRVRRQGGAGALPGGDGLRRQVALRIRDLLKLPDHRRLWNRRARRVIQADPPGILLTTSPYDSTHLIGLVLRRRLPLYWVADFRDSWDHRRWIDGPVSPLHSRYNDRLERQVLQRADLVTWFHDIGIDFARQRVGDEVVRKSIAVPNGVDRGTRELLARFHRSAGTPPRFVHAGTLWRFRYPPEFARVWQWFARERLPGAELHLYGPVEPEVEHELQDLRDRSGMKIAFHGTVPQPQVLEAIAGCTAQLVWASPAREAITSKMYEAVAAQQPILFFGHPEGSGAEFLRQLGANDSVAAAFSAEALRSQLERFARALEQGDTSGFVPRPDPELIATERQMARLLQRLPPP